MKRRSTGSVWELDQFYQWVSQMGDGMREMEDRLARIRAWGVASVCWQTKIHRLQSELHKLKLDVTRCIAQRDANRLELISIEEAPALASPCGDSGNVISLMRGTARRAQRAPRTPQLMD